MSGQTKSQYSRIPTDDYDVGDDFSTTLKKSKKKGKTQGTYAILPDEEIDIEHELEQMNKQRQQYLINEQEIENMTRSARKRQPKTQELSLIDARVTQNDWPIMQTYKEANETNIRKSIARTDKAEREERIKQGLLTPPPKPPKTPRTPKQQIVLNNFGRLIGKSQDKKKENDFYSVLQEAEPLITKREVTRLYKKRMGQVEEYTSRLEGLERERAALQPVIERHEATRIQKVLRGHIGRNQFKKKKETAIKYKTVINSGEIESAAEQRLRRQKKKYQDKKAELMTRSYTMPTDEKILKLRKVNEEIKHYEDAIVKKKPGRKVQDLVQKFDTPKKK